MAQNIHIQNLLRAPNVSTPKAPRKKANETTEDQKDEDIGKTRRRLSVAGDNILIDGFSKVNISETTETEEKAASTGFIVSSYAGYSKKGYAPYNPRKGNQDALLMAEHQETRSLLLCVLDGHGEVGDSVSQFFKRNLPSSIFEHPRFEDDPRTAIVDSIRSIEQRLLNGPINCEYSGSTLVLCIIRERTIIIANVGDSRITLGCHSSSETSGLIAQPLSIDHKPDLPEEKERILKSGGRVFAVQYDDGIDGPPRVWLRNIDVPGLAMSRSLGDVVAHTAGVISEPEIFERTIDPETDCCLVLATDGLWEFMSDQEVIDIVSLCNEPRLAVDNLINEANRRWMKEEQVIDDTTVCVAFLGNWVGEP